MAKKRIYTIAKELDVDNKVVVDAAMKLGLDIKNHMSGVDEAGEAKILGELKGAKKESPKKETEKPVKKDVKPEVKYEAKPADKKPAGNDSDSHKTKIKVTAIRRPEGKRPGTQNNRPGTQNNRPGTQNNRPRNNNNGGSRDGNNQNRNNNFNNQRNNTSAPTPRTGGVGAKHLAAFKEHQTQETTNSSNRHSNNRNDNKNNNNNRSNNNSRPNNAVESRKPATSPSTPQTPISSEPIPVGEKKTNNHEVKRDFNRRNLANPFGSRKKKKNKKRQQQNQQPKKEMPQRKDRPLPETLIYTVGMNAQDLGRFFIENLQKSLKSYLCLELWLLKTNL